METVALCDMIGEQICEPSYATRALCEGGLDDGEQATDTPREKWMRKRMADSFGHVMAVDGVRGTCTNRDLADSSGYAPHRWSRGCPGSVTGIQSSPKSWPWGRKSFDVILHEIVFAVAQSTARLAPAICGKQQGKSELWFRCSGGERTLVGENAGPLLDGTRTRRCG